jgi:hypothetical protein
MVMGPKCGLGLRAASSIAFQEVLYREKGRKTAVCRDLKTGF